MCFSFSSLSDAYVEVIELKGGEGDPALIFHVGH
jgi:hypothetical protein